MQNKNKLWLVIIGLAICTAIFASFLLLNHKKPQFLPQLTNLPADHPITTQPEQSAITAPSIETDLPKLPSNLGKLAELNPDKTTQVNTEVKKLPDQPYQLFFDLRHILLHSSGSAAAKAVGVSNMFWYTVKHKKTPNYLEIQARLFEFMDYCTKQPRGTALFNNEPMPGLMCQWARGELTAQEFLDTILNSHKEIQEFFISQEEKNLVLGTLTVFKPDVICKIQRPITKMVAFFQECCKCFPDQIYILSNWDRESADLIRKAYPQIFDQIKADHIIFSSDIGKLKPEADIFNYVTEKMNLAPQKCILIDDIPENIRVAKSLKWRTILHKDTDRTIHKIKKLLAIKSPINKSKKKKKSK